MTRPVVFRFRLFIAARTQNSSLAQTNLRRLCADYLADRHTIEIVDVLSAPERALEARVFMTPTLVRFSPAPDVRIIGTLSQTATVLMALGLADRAA